MEKVLKLDEGWGRLKKTNEIILGKIINIYL